MKISLITGIKGFIGRNLAQHLRERDDVELLEFHRHSTSAELRDAVARADVVFHLAGVNRPNDPADFESVNAGLTQDLCQYLRQCGRKPKVIFSSSIQAEFDNPYGTSKRRAEEYLEEFARARCAPVAIFRLKNVFGKWCRPDYNSVVATFCHNIARGLPVQINDADRQLELVHIDDVVSSLVCEMDAVSEQSVTWIDPDSIPSYTLTLADLAERIQSFRELQRSLVVPDLSIRFNQQLYATYLSYLPSAEWEYGLDIKSDDRGNLAEVLKSPWFGQIFVSRTRPGITRGNHYHHTKTEKFMVIGGEALIQFRQVEGSDVIEFQVRGEDYRVLDIPPGYTHSITNVGDAELITLFWASEIFEPGRPDTCFAPVAP